MTQVEDTAGAILSSGTIFDDRYRVERLLGKGERKQTYLAWDTKAHRSVALAVVTPGADRRATQREVMMLGRAGPHASIVTLYDFDLESERQYLVFKYLAGGELRDHCRNLESENGRLPLGDFFRLARQLCRALAHIHLHEVIHRDVSPTNIWLDERDDVHLGDFDTAVSLNEPAPRDEVSSTTEGYPAPELLNGGDLDPRSDLYSAGGVFYELLACVGPPPPTDVPVPIPPPSTFRDDVPPSLDELLLSMLAPDREHRPASAEAVLRALRDIEKTADIESLIAIGENASVEFKQTMWWDTKLGKRNDELLRACVKAVCALLNGSDGTLLIGVHNNGEVTGIGDDCAALSNGTIDGFELAFRQALINGLDPEMSHLVRLSFPTVRSVQICRVDVEPAPQPVFLVSKDRPPEFYVRKGNRSQPLGVKAAHDYIREHWRWQIG